MLIKTTNSPAHAKLPTLTSSVSEFGGGLLKNLSQKDSHGYMPNEGGPDDVVLSSHRTACFQSGLKVEAQDKHMSIQYGSARRELSGSLTIASATGSVSIEGDGQKMTVFDRGSILLEKTGSHGPVPEQFRISSRHVVGMVNSYYGHYTPVEGGIDGSGNLRVHSIMDPTSGSTQVEPLIPITWLLHSPH